MTQDLSGKELAAGIRAEVAAAALLRRALRPGDVVLVKASRAAGLDRLASALLADPDGAEREPVARGASSTPPGWRSGSRSCSPRT